MTQEEKHEIAGRADAAVGHPHTGGMSVPEKFTHDERMFSNGYYKGAMEQDPISREKQRAADIKAFKRVYADVLSALGWDVGSINSELERLGKEIELCQ